MQTLHLIICMCLCGKLFRYNFYSGSFACDLTGCCSDANFYSGSFACNLTGCCSDANFYSGSFACDWTGCCSDTTFVADRSVILHCVTGGPIHVKSNAGKYSPLFLYVIGDVAEQTGFNSQA